MWISWLHSTPACLSSVAPEVLQGGAGGQFGSSPLPLPEPLLLLLLPLLLLLSCLAPGVLQGGAGGQFGSSPLPQPEPLLLLLLPLLLPQGALGCPPPQVLQSKGKLPVHQVQECQGRVPCQPWQTGGLEESLGGRVGEWGDCPSPSVQLSS